MPKSFVVVFRGDPVSGGYPLGITSNPSVVRLALRSSLEVLQEYGGDDRSTSIQREGWIEAVEEALREAEEDDS